MSPILCRDCLAKPPSLASEHCSGCGSPRLLRHDEPFVLQIGHMDCEAFFAAVEKRDDPSLRDKPVIIGDGRRGVVSTCCYLARIHGVHSAMPMYRAREACPDAVVLRPNMQKYAAAGAEIREMMRDVTPLVEPLSLDEAFLDLSGTERLHHRSPAETLADLAQRIEDQVGVTVSIGLRVQTH